MSTEQPPTLVSRVALERLLRSQLRKSYQRYQAAAEHYRELLNEQLRVMAPDLQNALTLAREAESEARDKHIQALRAFTDFVVYGKGPEERSAADAERV